MDIRAKKAREDIHRGLEKAPQKTLRFYHTYHSSDGGTFSILLSFFFSVNLELDLL